MENLKVNDKVMLISRNRFSSKEVVEISHIKKINKKTYTLANGRRIDFGGKEYGTGDNWHAPDYWKIYDEAGIKKAKQLNFEKDCKTAKHLLLSNKLFTKRILMGLLEEMEAK